MTGLGTVHLAVGAGVAALGLHTLVNHHMFPRLASFSVPRRLPRMSVLIPARNEAARIAAAVRGWAAQAYSDYEVVVYDDDSSDETAQRARAAAAGAPHVRILKGGGPPPGWRGKPWACDRLRAAAAGEILVFADADVRPRPDALARTAGAFAACGADAVSAVPAHEADRVVVRALVALQNWAAVAFVPAWLRRRRPRWLAALNGQFVALRARAYDASGGFAAHRASLAEDVALGRRLVGLEYRVVLLDGAPVLRCEPYAFLGDVWRANRRNLVEIFFGSRALLVAAVGALAALYLAPPLVLALGLALGRTGTWLWTGLPLIEIAIGLSSRVLSDRRAGYPAWLVLTHPLAVAVLAAIGIDAALRVRGAGAVEWRGRHYDVDRA